jgi:hypothetical protein
VLAVARIVDCKPTEQIRESLGARETAFGDYSDGRYAFVTDDFHMLKRPFVCKGALGFWKLPRPITEADID